MRPGPRLSWHGLALSMLLTMPFHAQAGTDGDLCGGAAGLLCVPLVVGAAIKAGDGERAKRLLGKADQATRDRALRSLAYDYLNYSYLKSDDATDAIELDLLGFLLEDGKVDVSGEAGTALLQLAVGAPPGAGRARDGARVRQEHVARLAVAHGARASGVFLGDCGDCDAQPAFLALLLGAGADINRSMSGRPALFNRVIEISDLAAAERLIDLGADPDGRDARGGNVLHGIAAACDLRPSASRRAPALQDKCVEDALARTRFVVAHGADPNGKTTPGWYDCTTPYDAAKRWNNEALAALLLELGADPAFGARCKAAAPAKKLVQP